MISIASDVPFTTVTAQRVIEPKFPKLVGDSWRPAAAGVLGAVPLAVVSAALLGASVAGGASSGALRPPALVPVPPGVTVAASALVSPKYPDDGGD
jgi:hypothetical protein